MLNIVLALVFVTASGVECLNGILSRTGLNAHEALSTRVGADLFPNANISGTARCFGLDRYAFSEDRVIPTDVVKVTVVRFFYRNMEASIYNRKGDLVGNSTDYSRNFGLLLHELQCAFGENILKKPAFNNFLKDIKNDFTERRAKLTSSRQRRFISSQRPKCRKTEITTEQKIGQAACDHFLPCRVLRDEAESFEDERYTSCSNHTPKVEKPKSLIPPWCGGFGLLNKAAAFDYNCVIKSVQTEYGLDLSSMYKFMESQKELADSILQLEEHGHDNRDYTPFHQLIFDAGEHHLLRQKLSEGLDAIPKLVLRTRPTPGSYYNPPSTDGVFPFYMLQHFIPDLQLGEIEPLLESTLIRQIKMVDYRLNDLDSPTPFDVMKPKSRTKRAAANNRLIPLISRNVLDGLGTRRPAPPFNLKKKSPSGSKRRGQYFFQAWRELQGDQTIKIGNTRFRGAKYAFAFHPANQLGPAPRRIRAGQTPNWEKVKNMVSPYMRANDVIFFGERDDWKIEILNRPPK